MTYSLPAAGPLSLLSLNLGLVGRQQRACMSHTTFNTGMVGYIFKPIDPEALTILVLRHVMARRNG